MSQESSADVFLLPNGKLYHLGVRSGEINPRILTVGDSGRARLIAENILEDFNEYGSARNFLTFSGRFKGTPVSIVSIGMGSPNMDFLVKETSYLFQGKSLAFIRLGSCGIFKPNCPLGTLFISDRQYYSYRNYLHTDGDPLASGSEKTSSHPYLIAGPVESDKELTDLLETRLKEKQLGYSRGAGMSAETFYACQGRNIPGFDDASEVKNGFFKLKVDMCEMETHQLFHLCRERACKNDPNTVTKAASVCIGVVNRVDPSCATSLHSTSDVKTDEITLLAARSALEALVAVSL